MAKSARASTKKANHRRLAATVFGPAEDARRERLSAKLLELAKQPKPDSLDAKMDLIDDEASKQDSEEVTKDESAMEVDSRAKPSSARVTKKRIDKRKQKKSSIVFAKYGDRMKGRKKKSGN